MPRLSDAHKILIFFCFSNILVSFNISALTAVIPAISRSLSVSVNDAASIIPFYMLPYGLCALLYAPLTSRFSIRHLMMFACLLFALGNALSWFNTSLFIVLLGRVLSGLGAAAVTPLALMTLAKIYPKEVRGRVLGIFFSCSFFGAMLGLMLSAVTHWSWLFIIPGWCSLVLFLAFIFCPKKGTEPNAHIVVNYLEAITMGGLRRILIFIFCMSMLFHGVCKWYGVYLDQEYGYSQQTISGLIVLTAIVAAVGQMIGGFITDKFGRQASLLVGLIILGSCIIALAGHYSWLGIAMVLSAISLGWTIGHNGISTVLTDVPDRYRVELSALNSSVRFLSGGLGFWLSGALMQRHFKLAFAIIGVMILFLIFMVPFLFSTVLGQSKEKQSVPV